MKDILEHLPTDVIALMGLMAMVWGTVVIRIGQRDHDEKLKEVRTQVLNDHPKDGPNLREDVEEIKQATARNTEATQAVLDRLVANEEWIRGVYTRVEGIGRELHDERQRSIGADTALHAIIAQHYLTPEAGKHAAAPDPIPDIVRNPPLWATGGAEYPPSAPQ